MALSRRQFLSVAAAGAGAILVAPQIVFANVATDRRFVFVIQR
ncbi:twin-arginine translocation signal domain-containing protein, partial [Bacteroides thetaiotaomicron]|nr:twin-arginine translocation signal domain-containing protein [Bacteroides thetaiotaomicron]